MISTPKSGNPGKKQSKTGSVCARGNLKTGKALCILHPNNNGNASGCSDRDVFLHRKQLKKFKAGVAGLLG